MSTTKKITKNFWMADGNLFYLKEQTKQFNYLSETKGVKHALELWGEDVFGCVIHNDGDFALETYGVPKADDELFQMFMDQVKEGEQ